jgi:hypothetical protein
MKRRASLALFFTLTSAVVGGFGKNRTPALAAEPVHLGFWFRSAIRGDGRPFIHSPLNNR